MHAPLLLRNFLKKSYPSIHSKRLASLLRASQSLFSGANLTLTSIGRNLNGSAYVKHKIKAADRLISNQFLKSESFLIYKTLSHLIIGPRQSITLLVDWSPCITHKHQLFRARIKRQRLVSAC